MTKGKIVIMAAALGCAAGAAQAAIVVPHVARPGSICILTGTGTTTTGTTGSITTLPPGCRPR